MLSTSTSCDGEERIYRHHLAYQLAHSQSVGPARTIDIQDVSREMCIYVLV